MNSALKLAMAAAVLVVAVAVIACGPVAVAPSPVAPSSSVAPSSEPTRSEPSPNSLDTTTWTTYVSERYGFSIAHPADWTARPADHDWTPEEVAFESTATEDFILPIENQGVRVSVWSVAVEPGTSVDSWLQAYCPTNTEPCTGIQDRAVAATMDGHSGTLVRFEHDVQAFFLVDSRIYAIACWRPMADPSVDRYSGSQRLVEVFLSTMQLLPGGPAPSAATPSPS